LSCYQSDEQTADLQDTRAIIIVVRTLDGIRYW